MKTRQTLAGNSFIEMAVRHLERLVETGRASGYGPDDNRMWMASLDIRTGRYPADDRRPPGIDKRCYRFIEAPRGCNLYWDLPQVAAAHAVAGLTGRPALAAAADAYVADFLERCPAGNGILLWGNHYYYDAFRGAVVRFGGGEPFPIDPVDERGDLHEIRPLPPAWDALWRVNAEATERAIRALLTAHLFDPETGGFNRHADRKRGCAFLEAGGILAETAAWLFRRTQDRTLLATAARMVAYSAAYRHPATGLIENNPTIIRWDKTAATTEVGLWAGCLLRSADVLPAVRETAEAAVRAWLRFGYDKAAARYYGRLNVTDGRPLREPKDTEYQPGEYADLWEPLFPCHDYPMAMAEAAVDLYRATGAPVFDEAIRRWVLHIQVSLPPRGGRGGYAEHYGRVIHFLCRAADVLNTPAYATLARAIADDAIARLWTGSLLRGHPGEDRYDAVDGVGILLLALLRLETGADPDAMGFHF